MSLLLLPLGILLGPVLHHLAVRSAVHAPFNRGIPACESCGRDLPFLGLTQARCKGCGTTPQNLRWLVGLVAGIGMWAAWYAVGWTAVLPGFLVFAATTAVLFFADLDKMIIPNRIIYPGGLTATVLLGIGAGWMGLIRFFWQGLLAGLVYFLVFFGVFMVARGGFGFGDVRLAALLGTFTGFLSWTYFLAAIFYTGMAGGVVALIALLAGKGRKFRLPYGPLMILGAWASFVFARLLVNGV